MATNLLLIALCLVLSLGAFSALAWGIRSLRDAYEKAWERDQERYDALLRQWTEGPDPYPDDTYVGLDTETLDAPPSPLDDILLPSDPAMVDPTDASLPRERPDAEILDTSLLDPFGIPGLNIDPFAPTAPQAGDSDG